MYTQKSKFELILSSLFTIAVITMLTMINSRGYDISKINSNNLNSLNPIKQKTIKGYKIDKRMSHLNILASCDKILYYPEQARCYSYKYKGDLFNVYLIDSKVDKINLKKRLSFRHDPNIPLNKQASVKCYRKSGYDLGHLMPDADADYNKTILATTYYLSNVVPQPPYINRHIIANLEKMERTLADYKPIVIITGAHYYKNRYLKNNPRCINLPEYYYKIFLINYYSDRYKPILVFKIYSKNAKVIEYTTKRKIDDFLRKENIILINK